MIGVRPRIAEINPSHAAQANPVSQLHLLALSTYSQKPATVIPEPIARLLKGTGFHPIHIFLQSKRPLGPEGDAIQGGLSSPPNSFRSLTACVRAHYPTDFRPRDNGSERKNTERPTRALTASSPPPQSLAQQKASQPSQAWASRNPDHSSPTPLADSFVSD